jgi:LmbE family N-acetylglucosaminyl deacetylase
MADLFLAPHNDDETLFGSYTILRHDPTVITCLRSQVQADRGGPSARIREVETGMALWWLGNPAWQQLLTLDTDPNIPDKLLDDFDHLDTVHEPERVWAPAYEENGHDQHNAVSFAAHGIFGDRVQPYLTYQRGSMRTRGREVPFEPPWVWAKLRALTCYRSQIMLENTRAWFMDDSLREYVP